MSLWGMFRRDEFNEIESTVGEYSGGPGESRMTELERRLDRLALASAAMMELLEERHGVTSQDVLERMRAIDLRDGKEDGRISPTLVKCRKCKRENGTRRSNCIYCGEQLIDAPPIS